jgi:hypothetical protein
MNRASAGASRSLRASCRSTSEAARMRPSTLSGSSRAARAVLAVCPAQAVDVGVGHHRREGGHGADHGRRREADHPVPGHRPAPRLVAEAAPLDAVRDRISEPSLKQQG